MEGITRLLNNRMTLIILSNGAYRHPLWTFLENMFARFIWKSGTGPPLHVESFLCQEAPDDTIATLARTEQSTRYKMQRVPSAPACTRCVGRARWAESQSIFTSASQGILACSLMLKITSSRF